MDRKNGLPYDGATAFMEGFDLEDNPWPEWGSQWEQWDMDFMEASKNYKEEGRFRDGSFKL